MKHALVHIQCSARDNAGTHENAQRKIKDDRARIRSVDSNLEVQRATTAPKIERERDCYGSKRKYCQTAIIAAVVTAARVTIVIS